MKKNSFAKKARLPTISPNPKTADINDNIISVIIQRNIVGGIILNDNKRYAT